MSLPVTNGSVVNSIAETTVQSFTVPGGTWSDGQRIVHSWLGTGFNNTAGGETYSVSLYVDGLQFGPIQGVGAGSLNNTGSDRTSAAGIDLRRIGTDVYAFDNISTLNSGPTPGQSYFPGSVDDIANGNAALLGPMNFAADIVIEVTITLSIADALLSYTATGGNAFKA